MIDVPMLGPDWRDDARRRLAEAFGAQAEVRVVGNGETPWSDTVRAEIAAAAPGGLIVTDLGILAESIAPKDNDLPIVLVNAPRTRRPTVITDTARRRAARCARNGGTPSSSI